MALSIGCVLQTQRRRGGSVEARRGKNEKIPPRPSLFSSASLRQKKNPAALRASARCEVFPAGRRKQHASRVLQPGAAVTRRRKLMLRPLEKRGGAEGKRRVPQRRMRFISSASLSFFLCASAFEKLAFRRTRLPMKNSDHDRSKRGQRGGARECDEPR